MQKNRLSQLRSLLGAAFLMMLATGFTDCELFSTVTVPSANTDTPDVYSSFYNLNTEQHTNITANGGYSHKRLGYDEGAIVVISVVDPDGATGLLAQWNWRVRCCSGTGLTKRCDATQEEYSFTSMEQPASPGQRVSNGIYDWRNMQSPRAKLEAACGSRARTSEFSLRWEVLGWGFGTNPATSHIDYAYYNAFPPDP